MSFSSCHFCEMLIYDSPPAPHRKKLLLSFAFFGATSAVLFLVLPSSSPLWFISALLAIFANVGFGASIVAMNAYLPTLAQDSEDVMKCLAELRHATQGSAVYEETDGIESPLLAASRVTEGHSDDHIKALHAQYHTTLSATTSRISSSGIALGYAAGIILLLVALIPVTKLGGTTFSLRLAIGLSGIWWAVFSLPAAAWLPSSASVARDNEREWGLSQEGSQPDAEVKWNIRREIIGAWKRLGGMLRWREVKKLRNTFQFLAAWFLLSDGFTTMTSTAVLFAKTSLHMPPSALILIGVITPTSGILGSLVWPVIQKRFRWSNIRILVTLVIMASMIPAYGCLGFLSVFQKGVKFGGLTTPAEMYIFAVYFVSLPASVKLRILGFTMTSIEGSVYGAFQGYARAFYSELIPPGEVARWCVLPNLPCDLTNFVLGMVCFR